jgi:protease PrsW
VTLFTVHSSIEIIVSLLPVFVFLMALVFLDSYKLLTLRSILLSILIGAIVAVGAYGVNRVLYHFNFITPRNYSLYITPLVEEVLKSLYLLFLIRKKRIGFMVDGAIHGFAIGAGFSLIENMYYLQTLPSQNILLWIIRGFGTAIMHGGVTAIVGIVSSELSNRVERFRFTVALPGLVIAVFIHALYNFFILPPVVSTLVLMMALPFLIVFIFQKSEKATRGWLGAGFDMDVDLLNMILSGNLPDTKLGNYFRSLQDHFPGEIIADMLCFLRIHLELSIRAKGVLLMREHGFAGEPSKEIRENFTEMEYLQKSIGRIGYLALAPLLHRSSRDLWQIHMLDTLK